MSSGVMMSKEVITLAGLPMNDPTQNQYQIGSLTNMHANPVDGGVFDVVTGDANNHTNQS